MKKLVIIQTTTPDYRAVFYKSIYICSGGVLLTFILSLSLKHFSQIGNLNLYLKNSDLLKIYFSDVDKIILN